MTIDRDDFDQGMKSAGAAKPTAGKADDPRAFTLNLDANFSVSGLDVSGTRSAGQMAALLETAKKPLITINQNIEKLGKLEVYPASSVATGNRYDAVAVVLVLHCDQSKPFLHTLVIEPQETGRVQNRRVNVNRQNGSKEIYEQAHVGRVIDAEFYAHVQACVGDQMGGNKLFEWAPGTQSTSLPYNMLDMTNEIAVERLLANSANALLARVFRIAGAPDLNVDNIQTDFNTSSLVVSLDTNRRILEGIDGVPLMSQGRLQISTPTVSSNGRHTYNNGGRNLLSLSLQSSFYYAPTNVNPQQSYMPMGLPLKPTYMQMLTVSDFDVGNIPTLGRIWLGLAALFGAVSAQPDLVRALHRPTTEREADPWYFGGLDVEANLQNAQTPCVWPMDSTGDLGNSNYQTYLRSVVHDQLFFGVDVTPHSAQGSFLVDFLLAAARNSTNQAEAIRCQEAHKRLYNAANALTMGRLEKIYPPSEPIVTQVMPLVTGVFEHNGEQLPLSAVDTLFIANHMVNSNSSLEALGTLTTWGDSWMDNRLDVEEKQSNRVAVIAAVTGETQRVTGTGARVGLCAAFLAAVHRALTTATPDSNKVLSFSLETGNVDVHNQRATANNFLSGGYNITSNQNGGGAYSGGLGSYGRGL